MRNKSFWVITHGLISSEDTKVLTLLYQPLIGNEAFGLYMTLINLVDRNELKSDLFMFSFLLDVLNVKENNFIKNKEKLEAVGLLTSLVKGDISMFKVSMPLKARQFFTDGILGAYLKSEIGEDNFNILFNYFTVKEVSTKGYINETKTFDEVFSVKDLEVIKSDKFIISRKNGNGIVLKESFDFEKLFEGLPERLKKRTIFPKRIVTQISSIMYVYQFTFKEMIKIISDSYDEENKKIFYERIALNSRIYYENTYGNIQIDKKEIKEDQLNLALIKPQDIISLFSDKMTNTSFALDTIRNFISRNAVDIGLINAVIIASLKFTDDLPNIVYLEKVLADWLSRGIKTGEDAYPIIANLDEQIKYKKKTKKSKNEPAWLDEIIDNLGGDWSD